MNKKLPHQILVSKLTRAQTMNKLYGERKENEFHSSCLALCGDTNNMSNKKKITTLVMWLTPGISCVFCQVSRKVKCSLLN